MGTKTLAVQLVMPDERPYDLDWSEGWPLPLFGETFCLDGTDYIICEAAWEYDTLAGGCAVRYIIYLDETP